MSKTAAVGVSDTVRSVLGSVFDRSEFCPS